MMNRMQKKRLFSYTEAPSCVQNPFTSSYFTSEPSSIHSVWFIYVYMTGDDGAAVPQK